jgi:hypothetical protein
MALSKSSQVRIDRWFDEFIRSEAMAYLQGERRNDFIDYPKRADRCAEAVENGADGSTHAEIIDDWRAMFKIWLRDRTRKGEHSFHSHDRFEDGVNVRIDACEKWHEEHGTLEQEVG